MTTSGTTGARDMRGVCVRATTHAVCTDACVCVLALTAELRSVLKRMDDADIAEYQCDFVYHSPSTIDVPGCSFCIVILCLSR